MREHDRQDAIITENAAALIEYRGHLRLVIRVGQLIATASGIRKSGGIRYCLVLLVREGGSEERWKHLANRVFLPCVEVVRELRVHHVVVVRRIHDYRLDRAGGDGRKVSCVTRNDGRRSGCSD